MNPTVRPERTDTALHSGGTVAYRVLLAGRWVGWIGDGRPWCGWRHGGRRWWACWREDGDTAARWGTDLVHPTRRTAVAALVRHTQEGSR